MSTNAEGIIHCWEKTGLLAAWDTSVQVEAACRAKEIFPNLVSAESVVAETVKEAVPAVPDPEAFHKGTSFMEGGEEDEWEGWLDWDRLPGIEDS